MTTAEPSKADAAKQAAADVKGAVSDQGRELASTAAEQVRAMTDEVRAQAGSVIGDARDEFETQLDSQARRVGAGMQDAHRQLVSMANSAEPGLVSDVTQQLADSLGSAATRIEAGGVRAIADDVRSFARRQPAVFLIGAGALGFLAARVLRAANTPGSNDPRRVVSSSGFDRPDRTTGEARSGALETGLGSDALIAPPVVPAPGVLGGMA